MQCVVRGQPDLESTGELSLDASRALVIAERWMVDHHVVVTEHRFDHATSGKEATGASATSWPQSDADWEHLGEIVFRAIAACDPAAQQALFGHVIICGATTLRAGFPERLHQQVSASCRRHAALQLRAQLLANAPAESDEPNSLSANAGELPDVSHLPLPDVGVIGLETRGELLWQGVAAGDPIRSPKELSAFMLRDEYAAAGPAIVHRRGF